MWTWYVSERAPRRARSRLTHALRRRTQAESAAPGRSLRDYVRLPADRYNVLDSKAVTRVSDTQFRVSTGMQRFVMFEAEPVGFIDIKVLAEGVEQRMSRAELRSPKPSRILDEINATLSNLSLQNTVTSADSPSGGKQLVCQVRAHGCLDPAAARADAQPTQLVLRGEFTTGVLARVPEARLNSLMSWALGVAMPWFLTKLRDDYANWARDLPRNASLGSGELAALARRVASGGASMPTGVRELPVDAAWTSAAVAPEAPTADEAAVGQNAPPLASAQAAPPSTTRGRGFGRPK